MKNTIKLIGAVVLVMIAAFPAFAGGSSDKAAASAAPGLTITGLDKWNGMRIQADQVSESPSPLYAASRIINSSDYDPMSGAKGIGAIIKNGTATLNVWNVTVPEIDWDDMDNFKITSVPYTGNDTVNFIVEIWDGGETHHWHSARANGTATAKFSKGAASAKVVLVHEVEPEEE